MITETVQGLGHTTMFCGDGINDLAALSAWPSVLPTLSLLLNLQLAMPLLQVSPVASHVITKLSVQKFDGLLPAYSKVPVLCLCLAVMV